MKFWENNNHGVFCFHKDSMGHDRFSPHLHSNTEILIKHTDSKIKLFDFQKSYEIDYPCILIFPPYTIHRIYVAPDQKYHRYVVYYGEKTAKMFDSSLFPTDKFSSISTTVIRCSEEDLSSLEPMLNNLSQDEISNEEKALSLAMLILKISRIASTENTVCLDFSTNYISEVLRYILDNIDTDLSLSNISARFGVNRDKLNNDFQKYFNTSVHQFIMEVRINAAKSHLLDGISVKDTAVLCGFNNTSYFMTAFKKNVGIPPAQYAKGPYLVN